jgi:hypothetical protein
VLDSITPPAALIAPNQTFTLSGSNFHDGVTVTFTDFQNNPFTAKVISREDQHVSVVATLGSAGTWSVTAANPGGKASSALKFPVANAPSIKFTSPSFIAFAISSFVATAFLAGIVCYVLVAIRKAQNAGWSLGEALSEESTFQPKTTETKSQVIIFASTSRVIALVGLMGILSTVIGMGYSIMWNLTIYGTVPDLTQIRSFLLGSACLFAPYLANQLSGIFTPTSKPQPSASDAQSSTSGVSGIVPTSPVANAAAQAVQLTGVGFQTGLSVTINDPSGGAHPLAAADIIAVSPTLISAKAVLDAPGNWKAVVANPAAAPMPAFAFVVFGPPRITGLTGTPPVHNAAAQNITFAGTGFVSGLLLTLTSPAAAVGQVPAIITQVTSQQVIITAVLADAGNWQVVATNPGNHASPAFTFIVT